MFADSGGGVVKHLFIYLIFKLCESDVFSGLMNLFIQLKDSIVYLGILCYAQQTAGFVTILKQVHILKPSLHATKCC